MDEALAIVERREAPGDPGWARRAERAAWDARIRLAERLGACVMSDLKSGAMFPTDHPAHIVPPLNALPNTAARETLAAEADVIVSLDWIDLGGALKQPSGLGRRKSGRESHFRQPRSHRCTIGRRHANIRRCGAQLTCGWKPPPMSR